MNAVYLAVFIAGAVLLAVRDPAAFLPALLGGAKNALALCATLACSYAVWMGFLKIAEDAGVLRGAAKLARPLLGRLLRTKDEEALEPVAVNLAANFLGMGGAATGAGVSAMNLLGRQKNAEYARAMFFVLNCSGLQLFSTTVLSLRAGCGSANPADTILPIFLSSLAAAVAGALLVFIIYGRKRG